MKTLIVSVWGNPKNWEPVKYTVERKVDKENIEFYQAKREYRSTLGALIEAYDDAEVLLLASSTIGTLSNGKRYSGVVEEAYNTIEGYLKNPEYCSERERVSLKILPGIGKFKDNNVEKRFKGRIDCFRVASFICSYKKMIEAKPERVILDISHGINYMPVYARTSVYLALLGYIASINSKIEWLVYNSEPKERGVKELELMLVEDLEIKPETAIQSIYREFETLSNVNFKLLKSFFGRQPPKYSSQWEQLNKETIRLVKTARNGLIIPFIETAQKLAETETEPLENEIRKYSYLENCDDIVEISENELKYLYAPNILSAHIIAIVNSLKQLKEMNIDTYEEGYSIKSLKDISQKFVEEPALTILNHELHQMKERIELAEMAEIEFNKWEPYNTYVQIGEIRVEEKPLLAIYEENGNKLKEIIKKEKTLQKIFSTIVKEKMQAEKRIKSPEKRNFLAHAGLERNITQIYIKEKTHIEEETYIKYDKQKREGIEKILENIEKK
jgi:CRISPR-associated protein Csx1